MVTIDPHAASSQASACFNAPTLCIDAPAKLNLFLEILGKREDGFHEIESVIVSVGLRDTLYLAPSPTKEITLAMRWAVGFGSSDSLYSESANNIATPRWGAFPPTSKNTVYRALTLLQKEAGISQGAQVSIVKRIPTESGMGGASSDAASALRAANVLWGLHWPLPSLAQIGAQIGSDIPFFLTEGAALCRGRGEDIESLPRFPRLWGVIVRPPEGLSTQAVYARCQPAENRRAVDPIIEAMRSGHPQKVGKALFNRLTQPAAEISHWIARLQDEFRKMQVAGHAMTGSGSSYFGICRSRLEARSIASRLRNNNLGYVCIVDISGRAARLAFSP